MWLTISFLLIYMAGLMVGNFQKTPAWSLPHIPPIKERQPLTDWTKFHKAIQNNKVILCAVVADGDETTTSYDLFLVDGNDWIFVGYSGLRGCGGDMDEYRSLFGVNRLKERLVKPPTNMARFVAVPRMRNTPGGNVNLKEVEIEYTEDSK